MIRLIALRWQLYLVLEHLQSPEKLVNLINKTTGEIIRKHPRCLTNNQTAEVEITFNSKICVERFKDTKELGRFMMRRDGKSIGTGIVIDYF